MVSWKLSLVVTVIGGLASGCAPVVSHRGYYADPRKTEAISTGVDTKATILDRLGTPTQIATFDPNTWYYISSTEHVVGWKSPKTVEQAILEVRFDDDDKVMNVKRLDNVPPRRLAMIQRATPTRGREVTFWEQMLGNVGRAPTSDADQGAGGRTGPRPQDGGRRN
jgi:outer membrane protein assembly factor BamE (lipoprotein component of BamABCDE complex)